MKKVVIIGAGLAGLTTAYELSKTKEFEITILEKADYVGGRVKSVPIGERYADVGALMVFGWYKHFRKLLAEIGLQNSLVRSVSNGQAFDRGDHIEYFDKTPLRRIVTPRGVAQLIRQKLLGKIQFYDPVVSSSPRTLHDLVADKPLTATDINMVVEGYTYDAITALDQSIYLPFAYNILLKGGFDNVDSVAGGTSTITTKLLTLLKDSGVVVKTGSDVIGVSPGLVRLQKGELEADYVVIASGGTLLSDYMNSISRPIDLELVKGTVVTIQCRQPAQKWFALYTQHALSDGSKIVCLGNQSMAGDTTPGDTVFIHVYIKTPHGVADVNKLKKEVLEYLSEERLGLEDIQVASVTDWCPMMPNIGSESLRTLREVQGQDGIYIAGDLLGPPCMETAVYSGKMVARRIAKL